MLKFVGVNGAPKKKALMWSRIFSAYQLDCWILHIFCFLKPKFKHIHKLENIFEATKRQILHLFCFLFFKATNKKYLPRFRLATRFFFLYLSGLHGPRVLEWNLRPRRPGVAAGSSIEMLIPRVVTVVENVDRCSSRIHVFWNIQI